MDFRPMLSSLKLHVVSAPALSSQPNASGATELIYHDEDLIPGGIRTMIEKLVQQKSWLIGKHPEYSTSEIVLSSHIFHDHAPFV